MKPILLFGAGALTFFEIFGLWSAMPGAPFLAAVLAAAAYFCGLQAFHRRASSLTSYFLGLGCVVVVAAVWGLVGAAPVPIGAYGNIIGPMLLCLAATLCAALNTRRAGQNT